MRKLILIIVLLFSSASFTAQTNYLGSHFGGGISSLQGFSIYGAVSFERKHNEITLRGNFNNQTGNLVTSNGLFGSYKQRYNDRFWDLALLYGRTFRIKEWFLSSISAGPALYTYTNKTLGARYLQTFGYRYIIEEVQYKSVGIGLQAEVFFITGDSFGLGLVFFGNINDHQNISGVALNLVFGKLRKEEN